MLDGPSLESSSFLNATLRYLVLGHWDLGTLRQVSSYIERFQPYSDQKTSPKGSQMTSMGVYFLCVVFDILKLPENFSPKLGYFQEKMRKICKKWGKTTKIKDNGKRIGKNCIF